LLKAVRIFSFIEVLLCSQHGSLGGTRRKRGGQRGGLLRSAGPAKRERTARAGASSPRGRTARRTLKLRKPMAKGRGRKIAARMMNGTADRMVTVSRSSFLF
jgi:hypothetical protein